jgi:hypothetical protein
MKYNAEWPKHRKAYVYVHAGTDYIEVFICLSMVPIMGGLLHRKPTSAGMSSLFFHCSSTALAES